MRELESTLATLLQGGTWIASAVIASGWLLSFTAFASSGMAIIYAGIFVLVTLPILRLIAMFISFLSERNFKLAGVVAVVLLIIALNFSLGIRMSADKHVKRNELTWSQFCQILYVGFLVRI